MSKLKDAHIFSQEKGSIAKFFVTAATYAAAMYASHLLTSLIEKEPFKWGESLLDFPPQIVYNGDYSLNL